MSQGFGSEVPPRHVQPVHRGITKYLVIIRAAESPIASLFLSNYEQATELDANTEEVSTMIKGIVPRIGATGAEWDRSLVGLSPGERESAEIYVLAV